MRTSRKSVVFVLLILWATGVGAGLFGMWRFDGTPGRAANPSTAWPMESHLTRQAGCFTVLMFLHPNCPCSRASLEDLSDLMTHCGDHLTGYAVFVQPAGMPTDPATTDLWKTAHAIPHVTAVRESPAEIETFGAETSGTVCLYDPAGTLRFQGGITSSRGHAGESDGGDAIESLVRTGSAAISRTPVFGCSLR